MRRARLATFGVPLADPVPAWVAAAIALVYLGATASRDLSAYDSAELALAAYQGGLAHPPGHALFTLAGWLATRLPVAPLFALSLLSAVPVALCAFPVLSIAESLAPGPPSRVGRVLAPAVFVLVVAHAAVWEPATRVEVYALAASLSCFAFAWASELRAREAPSRGAVAALGVLLGLATGANAAIAIVSSIACGAALLPAVRRVGGKGLALLATGFCGGGAVNLYVLLAPIDPMAFTWGKPRTLGELRHFLVGADYTTHARVTGDEVAAHLLALLGDHATRALLPVLVGGCVVHLAFGRGTRGLGRIAPLLVLVAAWASVSVSRIGVVGMSAGSISNFIPDYDGYAMPAMLLGAAGLAALARGAGRDVRSRALAAGATAWVALACVLATPRPWARTRADDRAIREYATAILRDSPRRAVLLVGDDHIAAPVLWLHEAESLRPDLVVLAVGLASSSWYWEHLYSRHPDLARFALVGPGARRGRIARLMRANADRPLVVDQSGTALEAGTGECLTDLAAVARPAPCGPGSLGGVGRARRSATALASWIDRLGTGSPATDEAVGQVAYARGIRAWRGGHFEVALEMFLVALPPDERAALRGAARHARGQPAALRVEPALPRTRPIFDSAASRAAACALLERPGTELPALCARGS